MQYIETLLLLCCLSFCAHATTLPDTVKTGKEYLTLAQQQEAQENIEQAIEYYELAKGDFRRENDNSNLAYVLTKLASFCISDTATHHQAKIYLDSAQLILDKEQIENDTLDALTWYTKARLAKAQREFSAAIKYFKESLRLKQKYYGEAHLEVAEDLDQIGRVYLYNLQNPYASEPYHEQALNIRERRGDQSRTRVNCLYHLTYVYRLKGDFDKALAYGYRVLQGYENMVERSYGNVILANSVLGSIYYSMDSIAIALSYNRKAIELAKEKRIVQGISLHYNNQAEYYFQQGKYDSTIYYAELALKYQPALINLANSYQFLGNAYRKKGESDYAFRNLRKSKKIKETIFDSHHTQLATLYVDLGRAFAMNQQIDSAKYYYQQALVNARISQKDTNNNSILIQTGDDLITIQEAVIGITDALSEQYEQSCNQEYLAQALPYFITFDRYMDLSRKNFSTEGSKLTLSSDHKKTYEQAIASSYQLFRSNPTDSLLQWIFHFTEKSKAMVLLESIHQAERSQRILPDSLKKSYQSLQAQLAYYQSRLIDAERDSSASSTVAELQIENANILRELESLNEYIQTHYPSYYNIAYEDMTVQLDTFRKYIPPHQPVVSYFWGDSAVYALLIASDKVKIHRVEDMTTLREAIIKYQDVLVNDVVGDPSYAKFLQFQESAYTLYRLLLEPLLFGDTTNIKYLTIVPDGNLTAIPFESLITSTVETNQNDIRYERLPYLIRQYNISYEFSLSIAFGEHNDKAETADKKPTVTAFGIKNFENLPWKQQYLPLGGAEREVRYMKEKFPQTKMFLNAKATEAQFKQHAPEADILHIATHGIADTENPFASKFIFYPSEKEDGILYLYELYDIPLKAQILLLSACESGMGKHYVGEGNFSLARSFVYAGCKSVMMSLWQVNDIITEQLIQGIYDRLEHYSINEAVRRTKLALLEEGLYTHPQCWASIVPMGKSNLKYPNTLNGDYIVIVILLVMLSLGTLYWTVYSTNVRSSIVKYWYMVKLKF
ncbi:MAG: CHAT domain-containing tetratricopeptide repeat protein [Bacteroidota bacterium]